MPNEVFFSLKSRTFGLGQTNWADKFWGILGVIPNSYLGLGFEFGPQKIRDLVFVCP